MNNTDFIGKYVIQNGDKGTIKYSGKLIHTINNPKIKIDDHWVGVQWNSVSRGNHNGNVKGVQYFECDPNTSGSLVKINKVSQGTDILKAYIRKYFKEEDVKRLLQNQNEEDLIESLNQIRKNMEQMKLEKQNIEYDEQAWIKTSISYKRIEFLGFDRIWKILKNSHLIKHLSLEKLEVSHLGKNGQVKQLFMSVEELSLCDNLFNSWDIVNELIQEFPNLKNLQLSQNSLKFNEQINKEKQDFCQKFNYQFEPLQPIQFNNYFQNLEVIALAKLSINFKILNRVKYVFKNVKELVLNSNRCNDFSNFQPQNDEFSNLEILDLTDNLIEDITPMTAWSNFKLKTLNLQNNNIQRLNYSQVLSKLAHLNIMDNQICSRDILFDLAKFPQLKSIKYLNNPICQFYDKTVLKCFIISSIPKLEIINGSKLKFRERPDSEIFYLRNTFHEFFKEKDVDKYTYEYQDYINWVQNQYPLTEILLRNYGNPYPIEERYYEELDQNKTIHYLQKQQHISMAKTYCLMRVIKNINGEDCIFIEKKIPKSVSIAFLKKYISFLMQIEKNKLLLKSGIDDVIFDDDIDKVEKFEEEEEWKPIDYFLIVLGAQIGFGCIWRFPFLLFDNGGAAFLIPYLVLLFFTILPLLYMEMGIGQYFKKSCVEIYQSYHPKFVGTVFSVIMAATIMQGFYAYLMTYCLIYIYLSIFGEFDFLYLPHEQRLQASSNFFREQVLQMTPKQIEQNGGGLGVLFYYHGQQYILLYGKEFQQQVQLPKQQYQDLIFYLPFYLQELLHQMVQFQAQNIFLCQNYQNYQKYSLGIMLQIKIFFNSILDLVEIQFFLHLEIVHKKFGFKLYSIIKRISLANFGTGIISGIVIFSYLGYFSQLSNIQIQDLPIQGSDLVFVTYPAALSCLPFPRFWMFTFFVCLMFIGIDSQFGVTESICYYLVDMKIKIRGRKVSDELIRLFVCFYLFLSGLIYCTRSGFYIITFVNRFITFLPIAFATFMNFYIFCFLKSLICEIVPKWVFWSLKNLAWVIFIFIFAAFFYNIISLINLYSKKELFIGLVIIIGVQIPFMVMYNRYKNINQKINYDISQDNIVDELIELNSNQNKSQDIENIKTIE